MRDIIEECLDLYVSHRLKSTLLSDDFLFCTLNDVHFVLVGKLLVGYSYVVLVPNNTLALTSQIN